MLVRRFDTAKLKFQLSDPDAYYVHHMSMYEHYLHQKQGFDVAQNKTLIMSKAAFAGECANLTVSKLKSAISFIPFYGGLPPNVTKDLAVKSIGQGNSLVSKFSSIYQYKNMLPHQTNYLQVDASTKALQTMATVCSCLKYFGNVIVGVTRDEDRVLIEQMVCFYDVISYLLCLKGTLLQLVARYEPVYSAPCQSDTVENEQALPFAVSSSSMGTAIHPAL